MHELRVALMGLTVLVAASAGCGGDDSSGSTTAVAGATSTTGASIASSTSGGTSGGDGACGLVTTDEAGQLLGGTVTAQPRSAGTVSTCTFSRDPATDGILSVTLTSDVTSYEALKADLPTAMAVSGVGDEAVWDSTLDELLVRSGDRAFGLTWGGKGITPDEDAAIALARTILTRL